MKVLKENQMWNFYTKALHIILIKKMRCILLPKPDENPRKQIRLKKIQLSKVTTIKKYKQEDIRL